MIRMKLRFRVYDYEGYMGGICPDGTIDLHPRLRARPMVLISVLLHELAHWAFDAVGLHGRLHYWNDFIYTYVGLYDYSVNRAGLRNTIKSLEYTKFARENSRRRR